MQHTLYTRLAVVDALGSICRFVTRAIQDDGTVRFEGQSHKLRVTPDGRQAFIQPGNVKPQRPVITYHADVEAAR